jgi:uncharacterized membrane protein (DUF106 family)
MLLLPEGQMGEACEPSKKQHTFKNQGELDRQVFSPFLFLFIIIIIFFKELTHK